MGTDIFAMVEVQNDEQGLKTWINAGEISILRNYQIFAALGNVRNYDGIPYIGDNRLKSFQDQGLSPDFLSILETTDTAANGAGYVTLAEMMVYDLDYTYDCRKEVMGRDADGKITGIYHQNPAEPGYDAVGLTKVFGIFPQDGRYWLKLIKRIQKKAAMARVFDPDKIRLVFYFY